MCFPTQGRILCLPKPYFSRTRAHHICSIFIKIYNTPMCYQKYDCNLWLYYILMEAKFNGKQKNNNHHLSGKTRATFCIPIVIKSNHKRGCKLVLWLYPVSGERTIPAYWFFKIKGITVISTKHVVKYEWKCLHLTLLSPSFFTLLFFFNSWCSCSAA